MKNFFTLMAFMFASLLVDAQYATVVFDYEKSTFNENQALPAETNMMFSGAASPAVQMIEVKFYKSAGSKEKKPLYESSWVRSYNNISESFMLPVNYKLRGGQQYDIQIVYYRAATPEEKANLKADLFEMLDSYVELTYSTSRKKITLSKQYSGILNDINSIVKSGMQLYRNRNNFYFKSFSDIVELKLKQIEGVNLKKESRMSKADSGRTVQTKEKLIRELKAILHNEVQQYLNVDLLVVDNSKTMFDYEVEKTRNVMALNAGYAASLFDFDFDDLNYGSSVYVGISVPLANRELRSSFLSNTSISVGIFAQNMKDKNDRTITGPFIKRPLYLGFGYRVIKFVRLNVGAVLLEQELDTSEKILIRPFIGASIDVNFWMGIGNR